MTRTRARIVLAGNTSWSMARFRLDLVRQLREAGHEVFVVAPPDDSTPALRAAADGVRGVHIDRRGTRPDRDLRTLASFARTYAMLRPDLVLNYTIKPVIYGTMAARLLGIPNFAVVTGLGSGFLGSSALARALALLARAALRGADRVVFLNPDDARYYLDRRIVRPAQVLAIPGEGIDVDRFAPAALPPREPGELRLLYVGRLIRDKGLHELIEAADRVARSGRRLALDLVGYRDEGNPGCITEAELAAWTARPHVRFHGRTDDPRPALARAHAVVLPSYREGIPVSLLEAGATGRPVVATDVPGCRDVVVDGRTGLLCRPRDAGDLARAIGELADLPTPRLEAMGEAARRHVVERYSKEAVWRVLQPEIEAALG